MTRPTQWLQEIEALRAENKASLQRVAKIRNSQSLRRVESQLKETSTQLKNFIGPKSAAAIRFFVQPQSETQEKDASYYLGYAQAMEDFRRK